MPHPVLGLSFASRDVHLSPSRLSRETELIGELYALLEPQLNVLADDIEDDPDLVEAIEAVRTIAAGGRADADTAHELLTGWAEELEETGDHDDTITARIMWLVAAWLSVKVGRHLRTEAESDPLWRFGGLVNLLTLPRLGEDFREVMAAVDGTEFQDAHRPAVSGEHYDRALEAVVAELSKLDSAKRLDVLYAWISPLLDEVAWENREFMDEPEMETAEAVERFRRLATGQTSDDGDEADAVHYHLTSFALGESEDQDPDMHVRSQAAFLATDWLRLKTGRQLRADENLGDYAPDDLPGLVNTLAWTRSRQISHLPEYVDELIDSGHDLLTPITELRAMLADLTSPSG